MSQAQDEYNWWIGSDEAAEYFGNDEKSVAARHAKSPEVLLARIDKLEGDLSTLLFRHAARNNEYNSLKAQVHRLLKALSEMDGFNPPQEMREMLEGL